MKNHKPLYIMVIAILIPGFFKLYGQYLWTQTDWSDNQYTSFENLDPDASPGELILLNDPSNMVFAFSPTALEGVWDLEVYNEKLFIAACTDPVAVDGGEILSYNYGTDTYNLEYEVWEQGVIQLRTFNGKLWVPGVDSQGSFDWGNFYIYDGNSWTMKSTIPHGIHVFDLVFYKGAMYTSTGTDLNNAGKIYKSTDEGDTWTEVFSVAPVGADFRRFYMMGIFQDTLHVQSDLKQPEGKVLFRFDGTNWTTVPFDSLVSSVGKLEQYNDKFYFLNGPLLQIYDGLEWQTADLPFSGWVDDPQHTGPRIQKSMCFYKNDIYGGGEEGKIYRSADGFTWEQIAETGSMLEEIEAIEVYHGRLYVGVNDTTGVGKVYVSASVPSGVLISEKHNFIYPIAAGTVNWIALIPSPLASVRFQIRTATSENGLEMAQFVGPNGTPQSFYEIPGQAFHDSHFGHNWIQYKVFMTSLGNEYTPVLQEITVAAFLVSSFDELLGNHTHLQCYPNPFTTNTSIRYSLAQNSMVSVQITDLVGQEILQPVNEFQFRGDHRVKVDCSMLNSGIYLCILKTNHNDSGKTIKIIKH